MTKTQRQQLEAFRVAVAAWDDQVVDRETGLGRNGAHAQAAQAARKGGYRAIRDAYKYNNRHWPLAVCAAANNFLDSLNGEG